MKSIRILVLSGFAVLAAATTTEAVDQHHTTDGAAEPPPAAATPPAQPQMMGPGMMNMPMMMEMMASGDMGMHQRRMMAHGMEMMGHALSLMGSAMTMMGPGMGMMDRDMTMMDPGAMGTMADPGAMAPRADSFMGERMEGHVAFLAAELALTEAQKPLWDTFADALRAQAQNMKDMRGMMQPAASTLTLTARLEQQEQTLTARLDGVRQLKTALAALIAVLDETQKATLEELAPMQFGLHAK